MLIYRNIHLSPKSFIINCKLWKNVMICWWNRLENCDIWDYTYISWSEAWGVSGYYKNVKIGKFCSIAHNVEFVNNSHYLNRFSAYPFRSLPSSPFYEKWNFDDIYEMFYEVWNDVWIWTWAKIIGNIKIWDGAVIAAGAIVTKDVPAYSIVAGVPAKIVKTRDCKHSQWWTYSFTELKNII